MSGCDAAVKRLDSNDPDEWLAELPRRGWWLYYTPDRTNPDCIGAVFRWPSMFSMCDVVIIMGLRNWYYRVVLDHPDADPFDPQVLVYSSAYEPPESIIREALDVPAPWEEGAPVEPGPVWEEEREITGRLRGRQMVVIPPQRRRPDAGPGSSFNAAKPSSRAS